MTWLAIIGTLMLLITFFTTKERVVPKPEQESTLGADLKDLKKNKPWIIMLVVTALIFITLAMKGGSYVYYFNNYVDEVSLQHFISPFTNFFNSIGMNFFGEDPRSAGFGLFNAGGIIMMIVGITFSKKFADKYGKRDAFIASLFISTLFVLAFIFYPPKSVGLMFLSHILHGFFYGIGTPLLWAMIADVADYSEWKNNRRATAIIFSAMMVGLKVGLSIGSSLVAYIIGQYGYISSGGAVNVIQPETVSAGAKMLVSVFPSIPFFLACGLLMFYEINKKKEIEIEHDLKERRAKD
jgi:Na+/melibiose symporter-like transporter